MEIENIKIKMDVSFSPILENKSEIRVETGETVNTNCGQFIITYVGVYGGVINLTMKRKGQ
jgi:hypothetical protein